MLRCAMELRPHNQAAQPCCKQDRRGHRGEPRPASACLSAGLKPLLGPGLGGWPRASGHGPTGGAFGRDGLLCRFPAYR
eukprot:scaffold17676_cov108-Isochrysis_galbana.AAC.8